VQKATMTAIEKGQLEAGARTAVLVRRSDLPVPFAHGARSFFGGLPKLPPKFDWPRSEVTAEKKETVALTFIAQIDLAELPDSEARSLLPKTGTLYFFCSSMFVGEGRPPCRIYYYRASADPLPERAPPPDLMPLAGNGGDSQVKWLDPATDLHSKVEFKYPISFLPFRDSRFKKMTILSVASFASQPFVKLWVQVTARKRTCSRTEQQTTTQKTKIGRSISY
jgi:hypothetical protein